MLLFNERKKYRCQNIDKNPLNEKSTECESIRQNQELKCNNRLL